MSRFTYSIFLIICLATSTSCDDFDCVKNAGDIIRVSVPVAHFHSISANDGIRIIIRQAENQEVIVEAGENLINDIKLVVDSLGYLNIANENKCNWVRDYKAITVFVYTDTLRLINQFGYGEISSEGTLTFESITVNAKNGTGDVHLQVNNKKTYIVSNSIANFYLSGYSSNLVVGYYYNNGILFAQSLLADKVNITHLGTNTLYVSAGQSISGTIQSTGNIVYYGAPTNIDVTITGEGKLIKK